jgi:hypothetical protein
VDAAGVATEAAGTDVGEVPAPVDVDPVAVAARVSDIVNWTGNGQALPPDDELAEDAAAFELPWVAVLSETLLTPETRRSCTMVWATVDSSWAQPVSWTAEALAALAAAPAAGAVEDAAEGVDGAVA